MQLFLRYNFIEAIQLYSITGYKKSETVIYVPDLNLIMSKSLNEVIATVYNRLFTLKYNVFLFKF